MTETTTINVELKYLETLVLEHYKKELNDTNINLKTVITSDDYCDYLNFVITKSVKIGVYEGKTEYALRVADITEILNKDLEESGYKLDFFNYEINNKKVENIKATVKQIGKVKQKTL